MSSLFFQIALLAEKLPKIVISTKKSKNRGFGAPNVVKTLCISTFFAMDPRMTKLAPKEQNSTQNDFFGEIQKFVHNFGKSEKISFCVLGKKVLQNH